jgi:presqualene diphosphate synthase
VFRACPRPRAACISRLASQLPDRLQQAPPAEIVLAVSNPVVDDTEIDAAAATSGSSFYLAMRILPAAQRDAMYQVYAFCRAVDDIADSDLPRAERAAGLERWRADIDACYAGAPRGSLRELTRHIHTFHLQREDFHAMIDGMAMDAAEDICAPDEATLDLYCDRVASAAGRLSVRIFGMRDEPGRLLAHHLGRALQLTNILRDIDEDAGINRCYLPRDLLAREGIAALNPRQIADDPSLPRVCATLAERARAHFAESDAIMDREPRAQVKAPRIMSGVYRVLLDRTLERGFDIPRTKVSKPRLRLMWIVARYALF